MGPSVRLGVDTARRGGRTDRGPEPDPDYLRRSVRLRKRSLLAADRGPGQSLWRRDNCCSLSRGAGIATADALLESGSVHRVIPRQEDLVVYHLMARRGRDSSAVGMTRCSK